MQDSNNKQPIEFTPFRQVPTWDDSTEFTMTGAQIRAIQKLFESYNEFVGIFEKFFLENLDNGKITINYEDLEGKPLTKEDIEAMLRAYEQQIAHKMKMKHSQDAPSVVTD